MTIAIKDNLQRTADLFRLGQEATASVELRLLLDQIEKNHSKLIQSDEFNKLLPLMLIAQEQHDWLGLADYLEYELMALV